MNESLEINESPSFTIFHGFFLSFYSKPFYKYAAENFVFKSYLFLLIFVCLYTVPRLYEFKQHINKFMEQSLPLYAQQVPPMTIKDGKVSVDSLEKEVFIRDIDDSSVTYVIINTTATRLDVDRYFSENETLGAVLTEDAFYVATQQGGEPEKHPLTDIEDFSIDENYILDNAKSISGWFSTFGMMIFVAIVYCYRLFLALLLAIIASSIKPVSLGDSFLFSRVYAISIFAMTPAAIIGLIHDGLGLHIPYFWSLCVIISILFVRFALQGVAEQKETPTSDTLLN